MAHEANWIIPLVILIVAVMGFTLYQLIVNRVNTVLAQSGMEGFDEGAAEMSPGTSDMPPPEVSTDRDVNAGTDPEDLMDDAEQPMTADASAIQRMTTETAELTTTPTQLTPYPTSAPKLTDQDPPFNHPNEGEAVNDPEIKQTLRGRFVWYETWLRRQPQRNLSARDQSNLNALNRGEMLKIKDLPDWLWLNPNDPQNRIAQQMARTQYDSVCGDYHQRIEDQLNRLAKRCKIANEFVSARDYVYPFNADAHDDLAQIKGGSTPDAYRHLAPRTIHQMPASCQRRLIEEQRGELHPHRQLRPKHRK